ncbi:MAG: Mov34/MPN/PAD-1 family protein [Candidatus Methanomethylophilaceae archaeon]
MTPTIISGEKMNKPFRNRAVPSARLFVTEDEIDRMIGHAEHGMGENKEVLGLLVGRFFRDDGGEYAVVDKAITSPLVANDVNVRFDERGLVSLFDLLDPETEREKVVVGWYHSHLDCGCFMSDTDIRTQNGLFGGECGFALVVDPVRGELKVFDSTPDDPKPVDMIVMEN